MASESRSAPASSSSSPSGKRARDPEDEVYLDNLRSQKRYLSEIMACSLNGLTVGDSIPVNMLESPVRSESFLYHRDDSPSQYSPMSEDSEEVRFCEDSSSQPESPVSPNPYQRPLFASTSSMSTTITTTTTNNNATPQARQRGSDTEGRIPSSPSDICHSGDLRRTALLRSVQMRTQPCVFAPSSGTSKVDSEVEEDRGEDSSSSSSTSSSSSSHTDSSSKSKSCKVLDMRLCER